MQEALNAIIDAIAYLRDQLVRSDDALAKRIDALEAHCAEARVTQSTSSIADVSREALQAALDRRGAR